MLCRSIAMKFILRIFCSPVCACAKPDWSDFQRTTRTTTNTANIFLFYATIEWQGLKYLRPNPRAIYHRAMCGIIRRWMCAWEIGWDSFCRAEWILTTSNAYKSTGFGRYAALDMLVCVCVDECVGVFGRECEPKRRAFEFSTLAVWSGTRCRWTKNRCDLRCSVFGSQFNRC